jgi:AcrR family transcriptional regulator
MTVSHMTSSHIVRKVIYIPKDTFFNLNEDKKQKIIRGAIDQFAEFHYGGATVDRIVKAAGIPKGSFYQYFENKDDLYIYLFTELGETKLDVFESLRERIPFISFKEYMMQYIVGLKKLEASNDQLSHLKREFLNECPQHIKKQIMRIEMPRSLRAFKGVIDSYIEKGEFRRDLDSKTAAYVTVMSISNLEHYDLSEGEDIIAALMRVIGFLADSMS